LISRLQDFIVQASKLRVAVAGETIMDEFIPVTYEGQSMKSLCPVLKLDGELTRQTGGAGAIAAHLKDFVASVELFTNHDGGIVKTRYVDVNDRRKHIEINRFETKGFSPVRIDPSRFDVVIIADFGHGFCDKVDTGDGFHLMCQTNSNNFGFNRISKWRNKAKKSVCLDIREASLHMNQKLFTANESAIRDLYHYEMNAGLVFLTMGKSGSICTNGKNIFSLPVFESEIVDTLGAGDTFFAFSSLAASIFPEQSEMMEIPALAASLSTTWLCNEQSVTKEKLIAHASRFV